MLLSIRQENSLLQISNERTFAHIVDFGFVGGGSDIGPSYWFRVNGKKYDGQFSSAKFNQRLSTKEEDNLKKEKFIVCYYTSDPSINRLLLSEKDFLKYKVDCPDSMKTVLKKYFKYKKGPFDWVVPIE